MIEDYNPGPRPLKYRVFVLPDPIEEKVGEGIIVKANETLDADKRMQTRGTLIDFSDMAFEGWECEKPKRGNRVEFSVYSGQRFSGDDEREYLLMNDEDLVAFWR